MSTAALPKLVHLSKILYGVAGKYKNITRHVLSTCVSDKVLSIPADDDVRASMFGDHLYKTLKHVLVVTRDGVATLIPHTDAAQYDVNDLDITGIEPYSGNAYDVLERIHDTLAFEGGNVRDEYPEQLMVVSHMRADDVVLELGSNIGRNTLTIASVLADSRNLVTLECDPVTCVTLERNRDLNHFKFAIEPRALSKRPLIQKGWVTQISTGEVPFGFTPVSTISYTELAKKYPLSFTVLVADCEGALYYILQDEPRLLDGLRLVIMENDYHDLAHKRDVDRILLEAGFLRTFYRGGGWGPCANNFFEVWQR